MMWPNANKYRIYINLHTG